jgi:3-methyladenine DNA glycosylase AlkC
MADAPLLKDLVDQESVSGIASAIGGVATDLDEERFVAAVFDDQWDARELKQRIRHIAHVIRSQLPGDYEAALLVLRQAATNPVIGGIPAWCLNDFVEEYGVDDPDVSLPALEQFTRIASSEFAVRPFILRYPDRMAQQMLHWARSDDEAVRRLASEGFRPRLPWGMGLPALKQDPAPILSVLDLLHDDPSETVRRSVANNLNDISKDHPELTVATLASWGDGSEEAVALRKHALRTLLKKGDPAALELLGFTRDASVIVTDMAVRPETVGIGDHVYVEFQVVSTGAAPQPVMIDYAVVFQNASGTGSRKVFKGIVDELEAGGSLAVRRKISLQPMSTRRIFAGPHVIEAQVNGVVHATIGFDVVE